jgi:hypothetical protein
LELDCPFCSLEASELTGVFAALFDVQLTGFGMFAHGFSLDVESFPDIIIIYKNILFEIIYNSNS